MTVTCGGGIPPILLDYCLTNFCFSEAVAVFESETFLAKLGFFFKFKLFIWIVLVTLVTLLKLLFTLRGATSAGASPFDETLECDLKWRPYFCSRFTWFLETLKVGAFYAIVFFCLRDDKLVLPVEFKPA
jgi:hypothetical protein